MPFVYSVDAGTLYTAGATNTEDPTIVVRQAVRGVDLTGMYAAGRANAATTISGLNIRVRRWTTAGSGGTAVVPAPRRIGTTASTAPVDKATAITPGTVSGAYQVSFGFGKAGPGGWVARDADSAIHLEGGGADELSLNSIGTEASLTFILSCEIVE
jgi:hypothetical protein